MICVLEKVQLRDLAYRIHHVPLGRCFCSVTWCL